LNKTIIITGASSGIGKETALLFSKRDWNVIAASRNIDKMKQEFSSITNIHCIQLDVRDTSSIVKAVNEIKEKYQTIDVLVNNAGFAVKGIFEYSTPEQVKNQFETNVFGLMDMTREIIPLMRQQGYGTIINVSSIGGKIGFPLYSLYQSTKFAVEGFSEALSYELQQFNIKVKIIEPGLIKTNFYGDSMDHTNDVRNEYDDFIKGTAKADEKNLKGVSDPIVIAQCMYKAALDKSIRLRYHAGKNASLLLFLRKLLPDSIFFWIMKSATT